MSVRTSKFLSLVLRHDPARVGITLDEHGWTDVATLLAACASNGVRITHDELAVIVRESDKQRFALSDDGTRIRANQGHSVEVDLALAPVEPPELLFHGTVEAALPGIRKLGLVRGKRHHVHLSLDIDTASRVGERRGKPIILTIRAADMAAAGHTFYRSENGVWLVDAVPSRFILWSPPKGTGNATRGAKAAIAKSTLAAIDAGHYTNNEGERVELAPWVEPAVQGTVLHDGTRGLAAASPAAQPTVISVTGESTIEAIVRLGAPASDAPVDLACLNFASAKNPGGGFLGGAQAQEESLARSSALYPCQLTCRQHYDRNRANGSVLYLDLAIYSPSVPFFRDDDGGWLARPVLASVITCAAPNAGALRQQRKYDRDDVETTLRRRAELVLAIAAHHGVRRLVLGAWGAGVFGNDPAMVADAFGALLEGRYANVFREVVFAIHGGPGRPNYDAFDARFPAA